MCLPEQNDNYRSFRVMDFSVASPSFVQDIGINPPLELTVWLTVKFRPTAAAIQNTVSNQPIQPYING